MKYNVEIKIMPLKQLPDPQGNATLNGLKSLGLNSVEKVRVGKNIILNINANSEADAKEIATSAAKKLLANLITESFEITSIIALKS